MPKDNVEQAAGVDATLTIKGKDYDIKPFTMADYIALRKYIRRNRIQDFRDSAEGLDPNDRVKVLTGLACQTISEYELQQEAVTPDGLFFLLWRTLIKTDPDLKLDDMTALLEGEDLEDLITVTKAIQEEDDNANPTPAPKAVSSTESNH